MTEIRVSGLEDHVGYWLRLVSNSVSQGFAAKVAVHGVTVAEWVVLRELFGAPPLMQTDLATRMGMTRGAISKLADRLSEKGLLTRSNDTSDARVLKLALTARGRKLVPILAALADANDAEFFGHMSKAERRALEAAMREIVERRAIKGVAVE
jgi:DNA-binding MarR family transcriptional regulator